jgi:aminoglycoside 6'-N-acetyltransferase I
MGRAPGILTLVELVAELADGRLVGFIETGMRSVADGCDPARPVGYVEAWFVAESYRRQGIGAQLLMAAEEWARKQGCTEMASDAEIENENSQRTHEALGFEVSGRSVNYRKRL